MAREASDYTEEDFRSRSLGRDGSQPQVDRGGDGAEGGGGYLPKSDWGLSSAAEAATCDATAQRIIAIVEKHNPAKIGVIRKHFEKAKTDSDGVSRGLDKVRH